MNIYETENLSLGRFTQKHRPTMRHSTPSLRYFLSFDSFRSTAKLLAIRSSKEENGADKEKEEEEDDVTVVASLRRY